MRAKAFLVGTVLLLGATTAAGTLWLHRENGQLRRRATALRRENQAIDRLREQNARAQVLVATMTETHATSAPTVHAEVEKLRAEIAALQHAAEARWRPNTATDPVVAANRNPEQGLVRIEHFQNAGRATPGTAWQTLVWATTQGVDDTVAQLLAFDGSARDQVAAMIAALPDETRAKYPTPEKLAALLFASVVTGHEAAQVLKQDYQDAEHATVTVAFERTPKGVPLPMRWEGDGWRLVVTEAMLPQLRRILHGEPPSTSSK